MDPEHSRPAAADDLEEEGNVARSDVSITLAEEVIYFMGENKLSSGAHRSSEYENSINCATKNIRVIVVRPLRESSSGYRAVLVTKISPSVSCRSDGSSLQSSLFIIRKHRNHTEPGGTMLQRVFAQLLIAVVTLLAIESSAQSPPLTRHVREATLNGDAPLVGRLPVTKWLHLVLALPLRNRAGLEKFLEKLYDPTSPSYRQFLTVEEFTAKFGPAKDDYDAVIRFTEENGLKVAAISRNRLNIQVTGTVGEIEQALHLNLGVYQHPTENRTFYAPDREPTPDSPVQLWHIAGLDNYSLPRPALAHKDPSEPNVQANATTGSGPGGSFLGSDMRTAYYGGTLTGTGQSLGLLEYYGTDLADLNTYYANVHQTNAVPITLLSTDGTSTSCIDNTGGGNCDDTEQTLDMTQALGMAPGMSSLVMYVGSSDAAILNAMATAKPLNSQLSSSWVWGPSDPSTDDPYFEEFAAQGQNYFQASGDWGEWSQTLLSEGAIYPSDDIYITSVGGTDLNTSGPAGPWSSETV
jgi:subtilase family serine protease